MQANQKLGQNHLAPTRKSFYGYLTILVLVVSVSSSHLLPNPQTDNRKKLTSGPCKRLLDWQAGRETWRSFETDIQDFLHRILASGPQ